MDKSVIFERYYNLSIRYLSYRPRSEKEILDYLKKKSDRNTNLNEEIISQIIDKLKSYKFVDDREFVKFWVEQRTKFKRKPLRVISYELVQKGISKDLIEETLSLLEDPDKLDLDNAKNLAEKKLEFYRNLEPKKRREKVMGFLLRKGFSYDTVKKILKY